MPGPNGLELALIVKAQTADARAQLEALQAQVKKTGTASASAASGASANAAAIDRQASAATAAASATAAQVTATEAAGESEAARAARIHEMVKTSLAQVSAEKAAIASAGQQTAAMNGSARAAAADTAAQMRRQSAWFAQTSAMVRATAAAEQADAILAKSKLTTADVAKAEQLYGIAVAAGVRTSAQQLAALGAIDSAKVKDIALTKASTKANLEEAASREVLSTRAKAELATGIGEVLGGTTGRLKRTGISFANQAGLLQAAMTPLGAAVAAAGVAIAAFGVAAVRGTLDSERLRVAVVATGGAAGVSATGFNDMAMAVGAATGKYGDARTAVELLAASGKVAGAGISGLARDAVNMATVTGQSVDQAVAKILEINERPSQAIAALNEQYHFLTAAQYAQIAALEAEGNVRGAARLANAADSQAMAERAAEVEKNAGWMVKSAKWVADEWSKAWAAMKGVGAARDLGDEVADVERQIRALTTGRILPNGTSQAAARANDPRVQALQAQLMDLRRQQVEAGFAASAKELDAAKQADAIKAQIATAQFDSPEVKRDNAIKIASRHMADQLGVEGLTDEDRERIKTRYANEVTAANKAFEQASAAGATKAPRAGKPDNSAQREAAQIASALAQAQDQVTQALIRQKAQVDPAGAAMDAYAEAVRKANAEADAAIKLHPAQTAAINATRDAQIELARIARDNSLASIAEKDERAWQSLLDSLRTPAEVNVDKALAQLTVLNQRLAAGKISADEYHATLGQIAQQSVGAAPQSQGLDAAVGGIGSELNRNLRERARLDQWHQDALAANEKFRAQDAANEEVYQARLVAIQRQYDQQKAVNEQARGQLALQTSANIFGQLATLSSSHNKKMATVGKAAAIAEAIIKTYQSANDSYASLAGIPVIGPALGAAAAAAAIAAGLANVAQIRSQPIGGYAEGGPIKGPGTGTSDSILMWGSNGEFMHREAAVRYYGLDFMHRVNNLEFPRFAGGGLIGLPAAPAPGRVAAPAFDAGASNSGASAPPVIIRPAVVVDRDGLAELLLNTPTGERLVLQHVGDNPRAIRGKWGA